MFYVQKHTSRRRGVRWGVRTGTSVRRNFWTERNETKREHSTFVVVHREEEEAADQGSANTYSELDIYSSTGRRLPVALPAMANPNHHV